MSYYAPIHRRTHLTAVGVGSRVCHGKQPRLRVFQLKVFVLEFFAVDAAAPCTVARRVVPALHRRLHGPKRSCGPKKKRGSQRVDGRGGERCRTKTPQTVGSRPGHRFDGAAVYSFSWSIARTTTPPKVGSAKLFARR